MICQTSDGRQHVSSTLSLFDGSILIQSYTLYYCSVDVHRLCCVYIRRKENKKKRGGGKSGVYKTRYDPSTAALYQTALLAPLWRERSCCWHLVTFTTPWLPSCIWIFHQCMHKISLFFIPLPPLFFFFFFVYRIFVRDVRDFFYQYLKGQSLVDPSGLALFLRKEQAW